MDDQKNFTANLTNLQPMLGWIRHCLHTIKCDETSLRKIELASEEALVNIIEHGYQKKMGNIEIRIREVSKDRIEIILKDNGPPFNPLGQPTDFNPLASLEDRRIGGLGIFFIRQYMDDVHYRRKGAVNILTLTKQIRT